MNPNVDLCPLCGSKHQELYHQDSRREYWHCLMCNLIFVPCKYFLSPAKEKQEYDLHQNSTTDPGYRRWLNRLTEPLCQRLAPNSFGLDFGCGPGPALHDIMKEKGHLVELYDPHYLNNKSVFTNKYDFITATEVFEHLHQPGETLKCLMNCLIPGGWLAIMTQPVIDKQAFKSWHYTRDNTHVAFYSNTTFQWIAKQFKCKLELHKRDIALFHKC
ncbi:class I SAM-dependent methyltransferase [bacterium]|nr:class I SAM-dependent methyltransferase [bacterium]